MKGVEMPKKISLTAAAIALSAALFASCAGTLADFSPRAAAENEPQRRFLLGKIRVEYMGIDVTDSALITLGDGERKIDYRLQKNGLVAIELESSVSPTLKSIVFKSEDGEQILVVDSPLPNLYPEQWPLTCFGALQVRLVERYLEAQPPAHASVFAGETAEVAVPRGAKFEYVAACHEAVAKISAIMSKKPASENEPAWIPAYLAVADPLREGRFPDKMLPLRMGVDQGEWVYQWTRVKACSPTAQALPGQLPHMRLIGAEHATSLIHFLLDERQTLHIVQDQCLVKYSPLSGATIAVPLPVSSTEQALALVCKARCGSGASLKSVLAKRDAPALLEVRALCEDLSEAAVFYFKLPVETKLIGLPCRLQTECGDDQCESGFCTRRCSQELDCGFEAACVGGKCLRICAKDADCPPGVVCKEAAAVAAVGLKATPTPGVAYSKKTIIQFGSSYTGGVCEVPEKWPQTPVMPQKK
jgi:hypothetical protein